MQIPVAIAVPIYDARELTQRCLESVLAHAPPEGWRLLLVDDASRDLALRDWLRELAKARPTRVSLLVNERNLGFTATANRAMRAVLPGEDLLLLNSDTEVFPEFLERLQAAAHADPRTGIVTPFSNNATLCSVPEPFQDNPIPAGYTPASFARLVAAASARARPELVTAVGFCMYVKGAALAEAGRFEEAAYGRGFGEENDFCEAAKQRGWTVRLCDDLFVWHKGKASFGDEGRARERDNLAVLEARHPGYLRAVQQFALDRPLEPLHARLRFHLPRLEAGRESAMLFLLHASPYQQRPGGTEHHVLDLVGRLALPRAVLAWPERDELVAAEILEGKIAAPLRFERRLREPARQFCLEHAELEQALRDWIAAFGVRAAHVHHTMRWPASVLRLLADAGIPFVFTAHDFHAACPNWNLFDASRSAVCPCDGSRACAEGCLAAFARRTDLELPPGGPEPLAAYRDAHRAALGGGLARAAAVVFPSRSAQAELGKRLLLNPVQQAVLEHGYDGAALRALSLREPSPEGPLRVLVLGETGLVAKGAENYLRVAEALRDDPVQLQFIGESARRVLSPELARRGLGGRALFLGRVERDELPAALGKLAPHAALLLPVMMETFSYVVSELGLAAIPIVVNEHGASAERVLAGGLGVVVRDAEEAAARLRSFAVDRSPLAAIRARARQLRHPTLDESAAAVRALYSRTGLLRALESRELPDPAALERLRRESTGFASAHPSSARPVEPIARAEPPASAYQRGAGYRAFSRVKGWLPGALRRWGRDRLLRRQYQTRLLLDPARAALRDLKLERSLLGESTFSITGPSPRLLFSAGQLAALPGGARPLRALRFRLRHEQPSGARARLAWTHAPEEELSEAKALRIGLSHRAGEWQDYLVLLEEVAAWKESAKASALVQLSFELTGVRGAVSFGPLELA